MDSLFFNNTLLDSCGIRDGNSKYLRVPSVDYGLLFGEVRGKTHWKKFIRYLVTANPDLFHHVFGYAGAFDRYAAAFSDRVQLSFGYDAKPYSLKLVTHPVADLLPEHANSFTLDNIRTAINRLLVLIRKHVLHTDFVCLPDVLDSQMLADIRAQLRIYYQSGLFRVLIHNGKLERAGMSSYDVPTLVGIFAQKYGGGFAEGKRLLDSTNMPAHNAFAEGGGAIRFAEYDDCVHHYMTEFQYTTLKAALCAAGCSPEDIYEKFVEYANELISKEN